MTEARRHVRPSMWPLSKSQSSFQRGSAKRTIWQRRGWILLYSVVLACVLSGWLPPAQKPEPRKYLEPRFPSYLRRPKSVEDVMPYARRLVRNLSQRGGKGLGVAQSGETIAMVTNVGADPMIVDAIKRALVERGVTAQVLFDYDLAGVSRTDALAEKKFVEAYTSEKGYMEIRLEWIDDAFPDPEVPKKWLRERRPDLYDLLYPKGQDLSPHLKEAMAKLHYNQVGKVLQGYLKQHPEVKGIFWGNQDGAGLLRALHPMESKFLGFFTYDNRWEVMSEIPNYPADLWLLTEEQSMEPVAYIDKLHVTDPEGTDLSCDVTEEAAQRWARGVYQRGHLYMFPTQATGRFAFSVVDYPALQKEWIPREPMSLANGVIAGTNGHYGFNPKMEIVFKNGYVAEVRGGGTYGDLTREFLKYPQINDLTFPFHTHPGYFYLYEIGLGTHPKWYRNPAHMMIDDLIPERNRSGVIHWGTGLRLWHDPASPVNSKSWLDFTGKYNFPRDHDFHLHNYFATYDVHLRNTDKWIKLIDRGHLTSLDNPEVRALASRYGDPDTILAEDWVPEMPGINAPGRYEDFARNPWPVSKAVIDKAVAGTYEHYYPPVQKTGGTRAKE